MESTSPVQKLQCDRAEDGEGEAQQQQEHPNSVGASLDSFHGIEDSPAAIALADAPVLRADPMRFAVAPIFCLLSITNAMQWITFSAIVDEVRDFFHMNATQVNFLASTYVISYVVIVFLSCKLYEVTGIKMGVLIAAAANALGSLLKIIALYVWPNAALLYLAQASNSITEVLTIATPPLIANRWFPEKERIVANTVLASALNFGCGIGVLIPTFFVGPTKQEKRHFGHLFWFQFALCFAMLALVIFVFPKKPRSAASYVAARQQNKEEQRLLALDAALHGRGTSDATSRPDENDGIATAEKTNEPVATRLAAPAIDSDSETEEAEVQPVNIFSVLLDCFRECRRNYSFVLLAVASAAELGLIWAVATVLPQMLTPYGVSEAISGWIGFLNLVLGTVVCPFFMPLVDKYGRRYKLILCVLALVLLATMITLTLLLHFGPEVATHPTYYMAVTFVLWGGVAGLCQNFMMPLMFEYVVELTFPMAESTSAPVLTWSACLMNFILALVFGEVLTDTPDEARALRVFIGATVVTAAGALALLLTKPLQRRQDYEMRKREEAAAARLLDEPAE